MKKEYEGTIRHDYFESTCSFLEWGDIEVEKDGCKQKLQDILFEEYKAGTQVKIIIETSEKE